MALLAFLISAGWTPPAVADEYAFDSYQHSARMSHRPAQPLRVNRTPLSPEYFFGMVGGVDLGGISTPEIELPEGTLEAQYDSMRSDGTRLSIRLNGRELPIYDAYPDWILIPTIRYVESGYSVCASRFGSAQSFVEYHIVYHPDFHDTLLGLRLFQADIFLMDPVGLGNPPRLITRNNSITPSGLFEEPRGNDRDVQSVSLQLEEQTHATPGVTTWFLEATDLRFSVSDSLRLGGSVRHVFGAIVGVREDETLLLRNISHEVPFSRLRTACPQGFLAAQKTARLAGFLRYLKTHHPIAWEELKLSCRTAPEISAIPTPDRLTKMRVPWTAFAITALLVAILVGVLGRAMLRYRKEKQWRAILNDAWGKDYRGRAKRP